MKHRNRFVPLALAATLALFLPALAAAESAREIDAHVDAALARFRQEVKGADRLLARSRAVLVLPRVIKGGLILGGEYGEGALRMGGRSVAYYSVAAASFGLTFGGEMKDIILVFLDRDALGKFRASEGWEAGVDGNVAVVKTGAGASIDTTKLNEPILGFVVGVKGLLVDASLKGSKFTRIKR